MAEQEKTEKTRAVEVRREPLAELRPWGPGGRRFGAGIERIMDRIFDEMIEGRHALPSLMAPAIDLSENDTYYTLTAELPGVDKDDVTIELAAGMLTIHGEKKSEREEKSERRRYAERSYGAFSRSLSLPRDAESDPARIAASYKDGILTVKIPRTHEARPAVIAIK
jgi:HSP20 family protein